MAKGAVANLVVWRGIRICLSVCVCLKIPGGAVSNLLECRGNVIFECMCALDQMKSLWWAILCVCVFCILLIFIICMCSNAPHRPSSHWYDHPQTFSHREITITLFQTHTVMSCRVSWCTIIFVLNSFEICFIRICNVWGLLWFWVALAYICFSLYVLCRCV